MVAGMGSANAATYTYSPATVSEYSGSYPSFTQKSSGGYAVNVSDNIQWYNSIKNLVGHTVTGYIGAVSSPAGGFTNYEHACNIPGGITWSNELYSATIQDASGHVIYAYHAIQDGDRIYTSNHDEMSYT